MLNQPFHPDVLRVFIRDNIAELAHPYLDASVRRSLADDNFKWFEMLIQREKRDEQTINNKHMAA